MPDGQATAEQLAQRIYHAVKLVPEDGTGIDLHCAWEVIEMMKVLDPEKDLTGQEMMVIAVILAGANDRRLGRRPDRPGVTAPTIQPRPILHAV